MKHLVLLFSIIFFFFVDDKLIRGVTGHRPEALQSYKRETDEQLVRVSKIGQGQSSENTRHQENFAAVQIPTLSVAIAFECFSWKL